MPTALTPASVAEAYARIKDYIHETPVLESTQLNQALGNRLLFKVEGFQKIGAFKIRGALNALLALKEQGQLPAHVVTFSSGNHAQACALAGKMLGIKTTICMTEKSSKLKQNAAKAYGATIVLTNTRKEAEERAATIAREGAFFLHPFDHDHIIAGQGTSCYEALKSGIKPDAIFATCGGGGWLSGSYLAKELLYPHASVYAGEPAQANDASRSYQSGQIVSYEDSPNTIADGATSLCVSQRTFAILKKLQGFYEVEEADIFYWTQWLTHLLKTTVEPTSAVACAAAHQWIKAHQARDKTILILLSGGNVSTQTQQRLWEKDYLLHFPSIV